jgi:hypothetical protein
MRFRENGRKSFAPKLQNATHISLDDPDTAVRVDSSHDFMGEGSYRFEEGCFGN